MAIKYSRRFSPKYFNPNWNNYSTKKLSYITNNRITQRRNRIVPIIQ